MKKFIPWVASFLLLLSQFFLVHFARSHPQWTEQVYSRQTYPVIARFLDVLQRYLPFSLAEMLLLFLILVSVRFVAKSVQRLYLDSEVTFWVFAKSVGTKVLLLATTVSLLFQLIWGLNYYRLPLPDLLGLTVEETEPTHLRQVLEALIPETNRLRAEMKESGNGSMTLSGSLVYYLQKAPEWYQTGLFAETFPILELQAPAKPVVFSGIMSFTQIVGVYFPFTGEANININVPDYQILATIAHEIAHRHGFAREDEANFLAWLVCHQSYISPEAQYSGNMLALSYALSAYYRAAPEDYSNVYELLSEGVQRDFRHGNAFWAQYEGPVEQLSTEINNQYLQGQDQTDGVQSYGRMVDLLIAYYRSSQP